MAAAPPDYICRTMFRARPDKQTLEKYSDIVFKTAEFMASYTVYDEKNDRYVLGPGLIPAQENHRPEVTLNPTFELEYWRYGLEVANRWRNRLDCRIILYGITLYPTRQASPEEWCLPCS